MDKKIEPIISELGILISQIEEKKDAYNYEALKQLLKENNINSLADISCSECHVLECIAKNNQINGIEIAKQLKMTRGGISKIANKLIIKKLITTYKDETNQKKIFYKLTELGEKVNEIHEQFTSKKSSNLKEIIKQYNKEEKETILRFIKDLQNTI